MDDYYKAMESLIKNQMNAIDEQRKDNRIAWLILSFGGIILAVISLFFGK